VRRMDPTRIWQALPSLLLLAVVLLFAGAGYQYYYRSAALATNQAYLKADVTWLTAQYTGEITKLYVYNGQVVQAQQPLLEVIDVNAPQRYHQQQALIDVKQSAFDIHEQNEQAQQALLADAQNKILLLEQQLLGRRQDQEKLQRLFDAGFATRLQLEDSEFRVNQMESQLQMARVTHQAIRTQYERLLSSGGGLRQELALLKQGLATPTAMQAIQVRAPISGVVSSLGVRQGSQVSDGSRMLAIVNMQRAYVEAQFSPDQIEQMFVGQPVRLEIEGVEQHALYGNIASLSVENISPSVRARIRRLPVRIEIDATSRQQFAAGAALRPGLAVKVQVLTSND
jgi:membrane fusion protein (multidrug efflux system)